MDEASWNREKDDADNRRTQATNAPRSSGREWHFLSMMWRQRRLERLPPSILHLRGGLEGTRRAFRGSRADSSSTCRAFCGSGARSSVHSEPATAPGQARAAISRASCGARPGSGGHFEPAAVPGQARAAISSQLRLQARFERPFRANSGSGPGSMSQTSASAVFPSQAEAGHEAPKSEGSKPEGNFKKRYTQRDRERQRDRDI